MSIFAHQTQSYLMNIEVFRSYCIQKTGVTEEFPFDEDTLVFKVMGKMFAATSIRDLEFSINLKCDPERAIDLRAAYPQILPGYHMNKRHWNTVMAEDGLSEKLIKELIDHSYDLVVGGLTVKLRKELQDINNNE